MPLDGPRSVLILATCHSRPMAVLLVHPNPFSSLASLQLFTGAMANHANSWFADVDTGSHLYTTE
ncbi:hypothetical protein CTA1_2639 [Colletotrichum tanaceti]|uniref:Uncharacterized protein n=1 Tax=Colletotrichum tanaceti TaxID=1306861 RepID=A0A4U6X9N8_9PEZI|nr:hypothetical protein CTA1_2639 [Colletotrichum tanaceti]